MKDHQEISEDFSKPLEEDKTTPKPPKIKIYKFDDKHKKVLGWANIGTSFFGSLVGIVVTLAIAYNYKIPQIETDIANKLSEIPLHWASTIEAATRAELNKSQERLNSINSELAQRQTALTELLVKNESIEKSIKDNLSRITSVEANFAQSLRSLEEKDKNLNIDTKIMDVVHSIQPVTKATITGIVENRGKLVITCKIENQGKFGIHAKATAIKLIKGPTSSNYLQNSAPYVKTKSQDLFSSDIPTGLTFNMECAVEGRDDIRVNDNVGCLVEIEYQTNKNIVALASRIIGRHKDFNIEEIIKVDQITSASSIVVSR